MSQANSLPVSCIIVAKLRIDDNVCARGGDNLASQRVFQQKAAKFG
ncbi:hypothetical protein RHD99_22165 [Buttiauxella selenatireducens]|uniref:Uncharacterized protein n=1 Tax=Buttiauxella selenatireducens TaxID=3073902 RepID=A0ABY9S9A7_9ENTR|nr:hypothetical protein [Buttiauxella sp. R73]WMY74095.1 hypothetical protein RHD99_22165 [Buttiauxella sp. R73]